MFTAFKCLSCKEIPDSEFTVAVALSTCYGCTIGASLILRCYNAAILSIDLRKEHFPNEDTLYDTAKRKIAEINKKFNRHIVLQ